MNNKSPLYERFWAKVKKSGDSECWIWTGAKYKGYGGMYPFGKKGPRVGSHRVSWMIKYGELPPGDKFLCHHCDNPSCVNPNHLYIGDALSNLLDAYKRNRAQTGNAHWARRDRTRCAEVFRGENHPMAKLKSKDVGEIKKLRGAGWTLKSMGDKYGVTFQMIHRIVSKKAWVA